MTMTPKQEADLEYTIAHFAEIARQNRFAENSTIDHDTGRCVVCHPERLSLDPFATYLEVITPSIKVRRPKLDESLVNEINNDLKLMGSSERVSLDDLISAEDSAVHLWREWLRNAIETGLELLSIHSATSQEFDLDDADESGFGELINRKIRELMDYQRGNL